MRSKRDWASYIGQVKADKVTAFAFGDTPDRLAELVVKGEKTATCSAAFFYELMDRPYPKVGQYGIVLNSKEQPVAIIRTVSVELTPMNEVTESFALAEGDGSYENWKAVHDKYFRKELEKRGRAFTDDLILVCERFELIDVMQNESLRETSV